MARIPDSFDVEQEKAREHELVEKLEELHRTGKSVEYYDHLQSGASIRIRGQVLMPNGGFANGFGLMSSTSTYFYLTVDLNTVSHIDVEAREIHAKTPNKFIGNELIGSQS